MVVALIVFSARPMFRPKSSVQVNSVEPGQKTINVVNSRLLLANCTSRLTTSICSCSRSTEFCSWHTSTRSEEYVILTVTTSVYRKICRLIPRPATVQSCVTRSYVKIRVHNRPGHYNYLARFWPMYRVLVNITYVDVNVAVYASMRKRVCVHVCMWEKREKQLERVKFIRGYEKKKEEKKRNESKEQYSGTG